MVGRMTVWDCVESFIVEVGWIVLDIKGQTVLEGIAVSCTNEEVTARASVEVFVEDESDKPPKKQISAYDCYKGESFLH